MAEKIRKAVIPVAGFGTRFLPATKAQPKEMLPLVDKPTIQYIVEEAVAAGIEQVIFITGANKRAIEDHFDRNFELEHRLEQAGKTVELEEVKRISYLASFVYIRQRTPSGLGHAILQAKDVVSDEPFAVLLGDDIVDAKKPAIGQLMGVFARYGDPVVGVTEVPKESVSRYGIVGGVKVNERVTEVKQIIEKPSPKQAPSRLAITGRYVLTPDIFGILEQTKPGHGGEIQVTDALATLAKQRPMYTCRYEGTYYDCGTKLSFLRAQVAFALRHPELRQPLRRALKSVLR